MENLEIKIDRNLVFAENQILETERLFLRPLTLADAEDMYEYASDEETARYVFPQHQSLPDTRRNIANYFLTAPLGKYGLELKATGKLIGTMDLRVDEANDNGEIGYTVNKAYWGQGFAPEAARTLLELGFEQLGLIRIYAVHDVDNPKSGCVMAKIGMKLEGTIPNARKWKGKITTDALRGITLEEYEAQKG